MSRWTTARMIRLMGSTMSRQERGSLIRRTTGKTTSSNLGIFPLCVVRLSSKIANDDNDMKARLKRSAAALRASSARMVYQPLPQLQWR